MSVQRLLPPSGRSPIVIGPTPKSLWGGVPMIAADMIAFVKADLVTFGAAILGIMMLVLAVIFKGLALGCCTIDQLLPDSHPNVGVFGVDGLAYDRHKLQFCRGTAHRCPCHCRSI